MLGFERFKKLLDTESHINIENNGTTLAFTETYDDNGVPRTFLVITKSPKEFPMEQNLNLTDEEMEELSMELVIEFKNVESALFLLREVGNSLFQLGYSERYAQDQEK
jgi:hypothetical protein